LSWLLAPYVGADSVHGLLAGHRPVAGTAGIVVIALSVAGTPVLGRAERRLAARLGSAATAGEGTQNLLCAVLAAGVLLGLAANAAFGWWWLEGCAGLAVAAVAISQGRGAWRGNGCC
jgi:divalent metal cation (Fe/Co/Zn/Cd) transporter